MFTCVCVCVCVCVALKLDQLLELPTLSIKDVCNEEATAHLKQEDLDKFR